jgi:hypothetical protein
MTQQFRSRLSTFPLRRIGLWTGTVFFFWVMGLWYHQKILTPESEWMKWLYEGKRSRLLAHQGQPRLIIVGGSGTFFGIDSELLEKQLGIIVVNGGTHAGLGLNGTLNLFMPEIQRGDHVIVIPEYGMLSTANGIGDLAAPMGGAISRPALGARTPLQVVEEGFAAGRPGLRAIAYYLNRVVQGTQNESGYIRAMNRYGDATQIPQGQFSSAPNWRADRMKPSPHCLRELRRFRGEVEARGGQLTIGLPWHLAKPEPETQAQLQQTLQLLTEIAPVMVNPVTLNSQSDVSLFSDTAYHLSQKGRTLRTQELAAQLKVRLQKP